MRRRDFMLASAAGLAVGGLGDRARAELGDPPLRLGLIGVGLRGTWHLRNALLRSDVEVTALCDIDPGRIALCEKMIADAGRAAARSFAGGDLDYRRVLDLDSVDAVIISTPWLWHVPMAVDAMRAGKYVGLEVSGAASLEECWQLVRTQEETGTHLMFLENVCYRRDVMAVLRMVRLGLFGELIHCEGGYQHDLRAIKFDPGAEFGEQGISEARWRTWHSVYRNADLYPTHGLGPLMNFLDLNRGNRLESLTSTASKARGLHEYVERVGGPTHPNASIDFRLGDVVTTVIRCARGEVIVLRHDTNLPRPYSLGFRVQGTQGLWMKDGNQIYIEGASAEPHRWEPSGPWLERYDHPFWQEEGEAAAGAGHGGMDYFVLREFVLAARAKAPPPIDVYDAATMMAITPLSERSIAGGGEPQAVPDFTSGRWLRRVPDFALS
ncbi:MAG: Gfo/Idh/MocA family protein [Steroidobacteraceae bacterium]